MMPPPPPPAADSSFFADLGMAPAYKKQVTTNIKAVAAADISTGSISSRLQACEPEVNYFETLSDFCHVF